MPDALMKPQFEVSRHQCAHATALRTQLGPLTVAPVEADGSHHAGDEEETGGRGPKACREVDLEVSVRSSTTECHPCRPCTYDVREEDVRDEEGQQAHLDAVAGSI